MDTTTSTSSTKLRNNSELDKFRLFYEFAVPHKEIKDDIKQRTIRRNPSDNS